MSEKLHKKWSPEQIANTTCKDIVCFKTIYNWIYSGIIDFDISNLRRKGISRKAKETRGRFNIYKSINKRPKEVKKRNTFGHWELDTVVPHPAVKVKVAFRNKNKILHSLTYDRSK
nr:IS30 family transposase [uncultured Anaerococcus sp.]